MEENRFSYGKPSCGSTKRNQVEKVAGRVALLEQEVVKGEDRED
jgi:hypothetical protein